MKYLIVVCCIVAAAIAHDKYTDKYDNMNLDEMMTNQRLLENYFACIMGRGPCTPEGSELKVHLQEAIETGCTKCTEIQEKQSWKVMKHLISNESTMWKEATDKFDPSGKWRKQYEERAKAEGVVFA